MQILGPEEMILSCDRKFSRPIIINILVLVDVLLENWLKMSLKKYFALLYVLNFIFHLVSHWTIFVHSFMPFYHLIW